MTTYTCPYCGKQYSDPRWFELHLAEKHGFKRKSRTRNATYFDDTEKLDKWLGGRET